MPRTAQSYMPMYRGTYDGRFDPFVAAKGAVNYLKDSYTVAESWPLAITSYNHGLGGVLKARDAHGDDIGEIVWNYKGDRFGFASRNFYAEFLAAKKIAKSPERYFADINPKHYPAIEGIRLTKPMTVQELSSKIGIEDAELIRLNPAWLANIRNNRRAIPPQTDIWVPKGTHIQLADRSFYEPGDFHDL
ncbi:MAG: lytic transglycosylase domain-containing protein, partial [Xanthomonadaceae bacterium]|nr:lytic transglycosylase domain-containing protein [Xanthomonadaceae bacterium]